MSCAGRGASEYVKVCISACTWLLNYWLALCYGCVLSCYKAGPTTLLSPCCRETSAPTRLSCAQSEFSMMSLYVFMKLGRWLFTINMAALLLRLQFGLCYRLLPTSSSLLHFIFQNSPQLDSNRIYKKTIWVKLFLSLVILGCECSLLYLWSLVLFCLLRDL